MTPKTKLTVQLITEEGKWPYVGNAYVNKDGSINLYFDEQAMILGGDKLRLRVARPKPAPAHAASPTTGEQP